MTLLPQLRLLQSQSTLVACTPCEHPLRGAALIALQREARRLGLAGGPPAAIRAQADAAVAVELARIEAEEAAALRELELEEQRLARKRERAREKARAGAAAQGR